MSKAWPKGASISKATFDAHHAPRICVAELAVPTVYELTGLNAGQDPGRIAQELGPEGYNLRGNGGYVSELAVAHAGDDLLEAGDVGLPLGWRRTFVAGSELQEDAVI